MLPVPSDSSRKKATSAAHWRLRIEVPFNTPIVGQCYAPPVLVIKCRILCAGGIAQYEFPFIVEQGALARRGRRTFHRENSDE